MKQQDGFVADDPAIREVNLQITRSALDTSSWGYYYPDEEWRWKDSSGVLYRWQISGSNGDGYPVGEVIPPIHWITDTPATDEYPELGHWETEGVERLEPGMLHTGPIFGSAPGATQCSVEILGDLPPLMKLFRDGTFTITGRLSGKPLSLEVVAESCAGSGGGGRLMGAVHGAMKGWPPGSGWKVEGAP